jgi:hypothetical protein
MATDNRTDDGRRLTLDRERQLAFKQDARTAPATERIVLVTLRRISSGAVRRPAAPRGIVTGDRVADLIRSRPIAARTNTKGAEPDDLLGSVDGLERPGAGRAEVAGVIHRGAIAPDAGPAWCALEVSHRSSTSDCAGAVPSAAAARLRPENAQVGAARLVCDAGSGRHGVDLRRALRTDHASGRGRKTRRRRTLRVSPTA